MAINNRTTNSKNYIKEFDNFSEGYQELASLLPEVKLYAGSETSYDGVIQRILGTISDNIPSPQNPNFPNTISFSINSREVGLLTDDKVAFGWRIFFNRENNSYIYQFRVTFLAVSMAKKKFIDALLNAGWVDFDFIANNKQQSRFWHKVNNTRRNNNRQGNYNRENRYNKPQDVQEDNQEVTEEQINKLKDKFKGNLEESSSSVEESKTEEPENISEEFVEVKESDQVVETAEPVQVDPEVKEPEQEVVETAEPVVEAQEPEAESPNEEPEVFSIKKGNLDGGYIINCGKEGPFTVNFNGDVYPEGSIVDKENYTIKYKGVVYKCLEGAIYTEE